MKFLPENELKVDKKSKTLHKDQIHKTLFLGVRMPTYPLIHGQQSDGRTNGRSDFEKTKRCNSELFFQTAAQIVLFKMIGLSALF